MVLDEIDVSALEPEQTSHALIKQTISTLFWMWYLNNSEDRILTIKKWFISKTIRVKDLRPAFELLFGHPPK